jgi:exopolysaccharide biosynthesis polyprenyl glycosylphosphotransferase
MTQVKQFPLLGDFPEVVGSRTRQPDWRRDYALRLVVTDVAVLVWAVFGSWIINFEFDGQRLSVPSWVPFTVGYGTVSAVLIVLWVAALAVVGSRGYRMIGTGTAEYKAVIQSGAIVLVFIAMVTFLFQVSFSRPYILVAIPSGLIALLASRWIWRLWLDAQRARGHYSSRVLLVGSTTNAAQIARDLAANPAAGYWVVGAVVSTGEVGEELPSTSVPILGRVDSLQSALRDSGADTVLVVGGHNLTPARMRQLSWSLEPGRQHLVMAPSLTDIAGPRIHSRPVAGLPLIHVETPRYEGIDRFAKRLFDIVVSGLLLLIGSVPLIAVAVTVKLTSPGGVFFSHERIGKNGEPFRMLKFRSMVAGADAQLADLLKSQGTSDKPLFKIDNDPRITKIGGFIRRYSIDEIPQLINVLRGDMSLVGPRPQVAKEVALYDNAAARRLFVKPGMTGLWQVSGRSNLDWDESVRLDLYYVENWSLLADFAILARTAKAVLASDGAV